MNEEQRLAAIKFYRNATKEPQEEWDGSLEQAKRQADEFTDGYGLKAFVIRRKNKYEWVTEWFFETYTYKGKIFYETEVKNENSK